MRLLTLGLISAGLLLYTGCRKEDSSPDAAEDNCNVQRALSDGDPIPGQYIVVYKSGPGLRSPSAQAVEQAGRDILAENRISATAMQRSFGGEIGGFVARLSPAEAQRLADDAAVQTVEQDRIIALNTCFTVVAPTLITWNINKVGYGDGRGKTAWIIDSGIDFDHPDLKVDVTRSKSFLGGETTADDENGHGTHVAGIIGALNNNFGVLGVASGANLVSLRVLDKEGVGKLSSVIQALSYINANAKAGDVVNMSIGEEETSATLDQQVQLTASKGILITIAAGNDGKAANLYSPGRANASNIYTVSAVDSLDNFASFSNFGNDVVDYAAPGVRILSTYKDGKYARMSGTSMAAPHVAGLLLLNGRNLRSVTTANNDPDGTPDRIALK
ncbi:MAG TPA: S8 family serine peptidase [Flavisolibacter sp.]|nr:S8 family serine peptidase [Flavisolibacter sp.]